MKSIKFLFVFLLPVLFLLLLPLRTPAQEAAVSTPDAIQTENISSSNALVEKLRGSGKTGIALFAISIVGFSFAFEQMFNLRKKNIVSVGLAGKADKLWNAGGYRGG